MSARVLLLDDDQVSRLPLELVLEDAGYEVVPVGSILDAKGAMSRGDFDLVILDMHLPDGLGSDLIPAVRRLFPAAPVIVLSGSIEDERRHGVRGADRVLAKGLEPQALLDALAEALKAKRKP